LSIAAEAIPEMPLPITATRGACDVLYSMFLLLA